MVLFMVGLTIGVILAFTSQCSFNHYMVKEIQKLRNNTN